MVEPSLADLQADRQKLSDLKKLVEKQLQNIESQLLILDYQILGLERK